MPTRAAKICAWPSCGALIFDGKGRCVTHRRARWKEYERRRPARDKRIYHSQDWLDARTTALRREPLCRICAQANPPRTTPATEVDHITPVKDGGAPLALTNLRPLCLACHSRVTMQANRAAGLLR